LHFVAQEIVEGVFQMEVNFAFGVSLVLFALFLCFLFRNENKRRK